MSEYNHENMPEPAAPVTFNPYKHHLGFLKQRIISWKLKPWAEVEPEVRCIGTNLIDFYYGRLDTKQIYMEAMNFAQVNGLTGAMKLIEWLGQQEYRKILFSDGSQWIIKNGQDPARYLHIHPAKHSLYTTRVRASTLKTVIALKISEPPEPGEDPALSRVNEVRMRLPGLSPVKGLERGKGILRLYHLFSL